MKFFLGLLIFFSFAAIARFENCHLNGKEDLGDGLYKLLINNKKSIQLYSVEECISEAKRMLRTTYTYSDHVAFIRFVNFKFESDSFIINGRIHRKN